MLNLRDKNRKEESISSKVGEILSALDETKGEKEIYFHGWNWIGASAVLKAVAKHLKASKSFDKVIHVDCSVWKSRRALQKAIAQELHLAQSVLDMIDRHDEDDDFNGVKQGSRMEIPQVTSQIFMNLPGHLTFVVVFHNGSDDLIDLTEFGVPVYPYLPNKVLWTFSGRVGRRRANTRTFNGWSEDQHKLELVDGSMWWDLVHEEAKQAAEHTGLPDHLMDHRVVEECILYTWAVRDMPLEVDWETHASNYLVCDGVIQDDRSAWEIGDALQSYVHLELDWKYIVKAIPFSTAHLGRDVPRQPPVCDESSRDTAFSVPPDMTSFFVPDCGIFQLSENSKLRVLHLSFCSFSFASPPFLCCRNLRFLLLNHCKDDTSSNTEEKDHHQSGPWKACFGKLWVLDLDYTELYLLLSQEMINVMADLRELNVKGLNKWHITDLHGSSVTSLVKLRVKSCSHLTAPFPNLSSASTLKTIVLDGCVELEQVSHDALPPSLESFSFINTFVDVSKLSTISFRGCSKLKSILLRGCLGSLEELDLSGTALKTLHLKKMEAPNLKRLILLGCEKLCAIIWPLQYSSTMIHLKMLHIDTTSISGWEEKKKKASVVVAAATTGISRRSGFNWYIFVRDARLLRSIAGLEVLDYLKLYMEIDGSAVTKGTRSLIHQNKYIEATAVSFGGLVPAILSSWMLDFPTCPAPPIQDLYVHIQDEDSMKTELLQQQLTDMEQTSTLPPSLICDHAGMLHVHDSLYITTIYSSQLDSGWNNLEWCRVERCAKLHTVFPRHQTSGRSFESLETFWASALPATRYIWETSGLGPNSFEKLVLLHLDNCPRVIHVLPVNFSSTVFPHLETLDIVYCGDLREVFPLEDEDRYETMKFPMLKHIHLHQLPALKCICECGMWAPNLETVKIRGCCSLKRLPAICGNTKVDCEKEWWDNLEWDGLDAYHHPSLYQATHSEYYKKTHLPRGTLLR